MSDDEGSQKITSNPNADERREEDNLLRGLEAFAIGVALFAASVAVAHAALSLVASELGYLPQMFIACVLLALNIAISTFGSLAIILALSMTGFLKVKGSVKIVDWGIAVSWFVLALLWQVESSVR